MMWQVLGASLEAHVAASDNSALAKDCRKEIKAANAALLKLARKVVLFQIAANVLSPLNQLHRLQTHLHIASATSAD
jgi:hypothetical protein